MKFTVYGYFPDGLRAIAAIEHDTKEEALDAIKAQFPEMTVVDLVEACDE